MAHLQHICLHPHISTATLCFFCAYLLCLRLLRLTQAWACTWGLCCSTVMHQLMPSSPKGSNSKDSVGCTSGSSKTVTFWRDTQQIRSNNKPSLQGVTHFKNHVLHFPVDRKRDFCRSLAHQQEFSIRARRYKTLLSSPGCKVNDLQRSVLVKGRGESRVICSS